MNIENEVWKPVEGYEGLYEVSNLGRVKSLFDGNHNLFRTKLIRPWKSDAYSHLSVGLYRNGILKKFSVHRLVANAFVPGYFEGAVVNHIDHNPMNNCLTNLEWVTQKENGSIEKSFAPNSELRKRMHLIVTKKKFSKTVLQFTKSGEFVKEWKSCHDATQGGFSYSSISACCTGRRYTYKGFRWFYKDDLVYFF